MGEPKHPSVLVVDDDLALRVVTTVMLEHEGFSPVAVGSAERALERLGRERFDVVLTDLAMPGAGGIELLRQLDERGGRLPVVVMTGSDDPALLRRAVDLGARTVLQKPVPGERLGAALRLALGEDRAAA